MSATPPTPTPPTDPKIEKMEHAFEKWREKNPDGRFRDFYVAKVTAQLDKGKPHATLGKNLKNVDDWSTSGRGVLDTLVEAGLEPGHVCVDYGCGSLRIGQHVMRYLDPGHYWGLDITDRFMNDGVELLGPEFIAERRPNLRVIAPEALREVRDAQPHYVFALAVLIHVAPAELDEFLDELMTIVTPRTTAFVSFKASDEVVRYAGRSWAYPETLIEAGLRSRGATAAFEMETGDVRRGRVTIRREGSPGAEGSAGAEGSSGADTMPAS